MSPSDEWTGDERRHGARNLVYEGPDRRMRPERDGVISVSRRFELLEERVDDVEGDTESLNTFRTEVRTALRVGLFLATVATSSAVIAVIESLRSH